MIRALARAIPPLGWPVLAAALMLTMLGLVGIYSAEAGMDGPPRVTMRQLTFLAIGLGGFGIVQMIGYRELGRWSYPLFFLTLFALVALLAAKYIPMKPFIVERRAAYRWITLGPMTFQVSEYAKITLILALAYYLRYRTNYRSIGGLLMPFILTLIPMAMILRQPDLGTSLLLMPTLFVMLYVAGARNRHLSVILLLGLIAMPVFYFSPIMKPYQRERIQALFHQDDDDEIWRLNAGFQLNQAKIAIGSGGFAGQGFQQSAFFRHNLLPEEHNDFIFAVVAHQWGFLGALFVIALYLVIITAGLTIASATNDPLGRLLAVGVCAVICAQTLINIGMTIGRMPITGMSLPFVSAGGSGLITNYIMIGLLVCVARRRPVDMAPKPFEFDDG